jgi:hypothetical protein
MRHHEVMTDHYIIIRKSLDSVFNIQWKQNLLPKNLIEHTGLFFHNFDCSRYDIPAKIFQARYTHFDMN